MKSRVYRLTKPYNVEEVIVDRELKAGWVSVIPTLASVCHADLRYFTGNRRPEALAKKLPMALIHEGIGIVQASCDSRFEPGDRVVIVPNIPGRVLHPESSGNESDQYSLNGAFMGSGYDGIVQSNVVHPGDCLVKIPDSVDDEIAVLAEVNSVSSSGVRCVETQLLKPGIRVALFGDGPVGYMTAAYIRYRFNCDAEHFTVFGADAEKLAKFDFVNTEHVMEYDFDTRNERYDVVIECTGGEFSQSAINQGIKIIERTGHLVLMGVSENLVPINTRDILEKGLTLYGSSRSITADFEAFINTVKDCSDYKTVLRKILPARPSVVKSKQDFVAVMQEAARTPHWKKIVMKFDWNVF